VAVDKPKISGVCAAVVFAGLLCVSPLSAAPQGPTDPANSQIARPLALMSTAVHRVGAWAGRLERGAAQAIAGSAAVPCFHGVSLLDPCAGGRKASLHPALCWTHLADVPPSVAPHLVLLIHGLDEPGGIWDDLAPALQAQAFHVARFDYPDDGPLATSADQLAAALRELKSRGVQRVDLVCHSMGGLVARDALTRPAYYGGQARGRADLPDAEHLFLFGTPNAGSPWASLEPLGELRERLVQWADLGWSASDRPGRSTWRGGGAEGHGEAGRDLRPGSAFLTDLSARPLPTGCAITVVVGLAAEPGDDRLGRVAASPVFCGFVGESGAHALAAGLRRWSQKLGDGAVPADSAHLEGVADTVVVPAGHRAMLRRFPFEERLRAWTHTSPADDTPPGIGIVLERLRP
jgi:pimeloyl-ACP methyl ester carboxylesterase